MSVCQLEEDKDSYHSAVSIARRAFEYVSAFKTPPVPEVYEVWYRFAEGKNLGICEQLSKLVEHESIGMSELVMLREQLIDNSLVGTSHHVSCRISEQLERIQGILQGQQEASADFSGTITKASSCLQQKELSAEDIGRYQGLVIDSNKKLQEHMIVLDSRLAESKSEIDELRIQLHESQKAITTDSLTEVGNRRYFDLIVAGAQRSETREDATYLFLIDIDNFKLLNDQFGHAAGDEVLKFVATTLVQKTGGSKVARYGGDEFAVVASFKEPGLANELAMELCSFFCDNQFVLKRSGCTLGKLTISVGVAMLRSDEDTNTWIERSDKLLYAAKNGGRNRCMVERKFAQLANESANE